MAQLTPGGAGEGEMMNICSDGHEEVCYEGRFCPACETIADKNDEIEDLREQIAELQKKLDDALDAHD